MKSLLNAVIKKLFGKKIPKISENYVPYVEKDTDCDLCEHLSSCEEIGYVLETTKFMDSRRHFIRGLNCPCKKRGDSWET